MLMKSSFFLLLFLVSSDHVIRRRAFASNFVSLKEAETSVDLCGIPKTKMVPATLILKKADTQTQIPAAQIAAFSSSVFVNETSSSSKVNPIEPTSVFRLYLTHKYISTTKFSPAMSQQVGDGQCSPLHLFFFLIALTVLGFFLKGGKIIEYIYIASLFVFDPEFPFETT